jgi:CBS domain containing-hemolysin-like protein
LQVRLTLARAELQDVLEEGHEVGILRPAQRRLAQNLFAVAGQTVTKRCQPISKIQPVPRTATRADLLRRAERLGTTLLIVHGESREDLVGYYRVVDLHLAVGNIQQHLRPLIRLTRTTTLLDAIGRLRSEDEEVAQIQDGDGRAVSLLFASDLVESLVRTSA